MKRIFEHPPESLTGKRYWRSLGELSETPEFRGWLEREFPAGAAQLEGDEISRRSFLEIHGRVDGAGRIWPNELSPARSASRSLYQKRGVGHSRQTAFLCDRHAATERRAATRCHDARRPPNESRRQPAPSRERRRLGSLCAGIDSRSLRSGAIETFHQQRENCPIARVSKNI